ncbi:MAG: response regulator [Planctomycetota bacterium]|jgi:CheY-like chemotaxis protein
MKWVLALLLGMGLSWDLSGAQAGQKPDGTPPPYRVRERPSGEFLEPVTSVRSVKEFELVCPLVPTPPVIDGRGEEGIWQRCTPVETLDGPSQRTIRLWAIRTESHLYVKAVYPDLSTVYGIVNQSGGTIHVYSTPGMGTTFKVYLPHADQPSAEELDQKVRRTVRRRGQNELILVAEDEEDVRKLVVKILTAAGYATIDAADGHAALKHYASLAKPIDLLLTDIMMPGMNGHELFELLRDRQPGVRALFMSGYTDTAIVHHGVLDSDTPFLQKPFVASSLIRAVQEQLYS